MKEELAQQRREKFRNFWPKVKSLLCQGHEATSIPASFAWLEKVMDYNVPHGKCIRGITAYESYLLFAGKKTLSKEEEERALVIGWAIEILQAAFLVADDLMDSSKLRRGKPCWYKEEGVGINAVNDAVLLENAVFVLLRKVFYGHNCLLELISLFQQVTFDTILGQHLDTKMSAECDFVKFTEETYSQIVKYKTAYYLFYLPVFATLIATETKLDPKTKNKYSDILIDIGHFFQVQDDILDLFGDPKVTGKIGTDIAEGKCTWLIVQALKKAGKEDLVEIKRYYKKPFTSTTEKVKGIFVKLGVKEDFEKWEKQSVATITRKIMDLEETQAPTKKLFLGLLNVLVKRNK